MSLINPKLIVLVLLLASLDAIAQAPKKSEGGESSKSRAITGKVVNESGQPLVNAHILARPVGANVVGQAAFSDRDGTFKLDNLERVSYLLTATVPTYTPKPREAANAPANQYRVGDSVTLVMIKGGVITGTVTNTGGDPVVAIGVRPHMVRDHTGRRLPVAAVVREGMTDDRGVYRIYGLPAGTYVVAADGMFDHSQTGVNAFASEVPTYSPSSTRDTAAEITVRYGEETSNVDIRYRGERGKTISGTVSEIADEESRFVTILTSVGAAAQQWHASPPDGSRGFGFDGIGDGDYQLTALSYLKGGDRAISESKLINVRGADIGGLELVTQRLGYITGRVVLEESKAPECTDKTPPQFSETSISAWHKDAEPGKNRPQFVWSMGAPVYPDTAGNFRLRDLAPSQYYFQSRLTAKNWYLHSIAFAPSQKPNAAPGAKPVDATRVWTNVKSGDLLSGLTVTLSQGAASLQGKLALSEGETAPEKLFVWLVPAETEKADEVLRFYGVAVSDDGKIALNNLAPGRYWMLAQPIVDDAPSPLTKLRLPDETRARARLRREAEAAKREIEFKPCQQIVNFELPLK